MTLIDMEVITITEDQTGTPDVCESDHCEKELKKPAHEAHFIGSFPCCWFSYVICRDRVAMFAHQPEIICNCGATVPSASIVTIEIPK